MRALACLALAASLVAGCGTGVTDPCRGIAGSCVSLTVQSSTVAAVDSLHILASGALSGDQTSSAARAGLPIAVALELPASAAGSLDLHVDGLLAGALVGSCDTNTEVTPGQHATALCTLLGVDSGVDMSTGSGSDDLAAGGPDLQTPPCDPNGVSGPRCVWRWQTPLPQGDNVLSVVAFTDADTYALTEDGALLHRDATKWAILTTPPTATGFGASTMFSPGGNSMDLYAAGTGPTTPLVLHSTDRGVTWMPEALPAGSTGFVAGGSTTGVYATLPAEASGNVYVRDNTNVWSTKTITGAASYYASAMDLATSVVVGAVSGTTSAIAYSTNSGGAWTPVAVGSITPSTQALQGVCLGPGATKGWWAVGGSVILHATGNAPSTWAQQGSSVTAGSSLFGCIATDSTHAWAFGANGALFVTSDGINWAGATTPIATTQTLSAGAHSSGAALTLVGSKGALYRSTNGGSSFTAEQTGPQDKLTAAFGPAPQVVYAVGDSGVIYHTPTTARPG